MGENEIQLVTKQFNHIFGELVKYGRVLQIDEQVAKFLNKNNGKLIHLIGDDLKKGD